MENETKEKLMALGSETLADALIELSLQNEAVEDRVERMIATPAQNVQRFKDKLARIKRSKRFINYGQSFQYARELRAMLEDLRRGVMDPMSGTALVVEFFKADNHLIGHCDDSSGSVGDVFRQDARDLFLFYARQCEDKKVLSDLVLKLNRVDDYGLRDTLVDCAAEYLPESVIRKMIARIQNSAEKESEEHGRSHWLSLIQSLARQIKDPELFEKTNTAYWGSDSLPGKMDIARVYLECGNSPMALSIVEQIHSDNRFIADERDKLLFNILAHLGATEKLASVAWKIFKGRRSIDSLEQLLSVIGEENRDRIVSDEADLILANPHLSLESSRFLLETGCLDAGEKYIIDRADQLDGERYESLLSFARIFEKNSRLIVASFIYRALLDSILKRAISKYYSFAVRYLNKLNELSESISDWHGFLDHDSYFAQLKQQHGRKPSFWAQYEKSKDTKGVAGRKSN